MADNNPSIPGGGVPPGSKVQPKKETVRINLPPKPSAAPTIKLPTLPPGGPSAGSSMPMPPAHAPAPAAAAPAPARTGAAPVAAPATSAPKPMAPRAVAPAAPTISGLDKGLAIAAAVASVAALGTTIYCMTLFN